MASQVHRINSTLKNQNRFSKHDQIGEVKIPLNTIDLAQTIEEWRPVTKVENDNDLVSWTPEIMNSNTYLNIRRAPLFAVSKEHKGRSSSASSNIQWLLRGS